MAVDPPMPSFARLRRGLETASALLDLLPDSLKMAWKWAYRKTRGDWPDAESADRKALEADIAQNRKYLDELMLTLLAVGNTAKALKCYTSTEPLSRLANKRLAFGGQGMETATEKEIADAALCLTELFSEVPTDTTTPVSPTRQRNKNRAKAGRPTADRATAAAYRRWVKEWKAAKADGEKMQDFCNRHGIAVNQLKAAKQWVADRKRRAQKTVVNAP